MMLLEDADDVADFLIATRRTIAPSRWAVEAIAAAQIEKLEGLF
jgi:hypothetical protein